MYSKTSQSHIATPSDYCAFIRLDKCPAQKSVSHGPAHCLLASGLLQGVKGPMLKQIKPAKFKLPLSYIDLATKEELPVPEVLYRANSQKLVNVPTKIAKRRARLRTLKTAHTEKPALANGVGQGAAADRGSPHAEKSTPLEDPRNSAGVSAI